MMSASVFIAGGCATLECRFDGAVVTIKRDALLRKPFARNTATWFKLLCGRAIPSTDLSFTVLDNILENIVVNGGGAIERHIFDRRYIELPFRQLVVHWAEKVFAPEKKTAAQAEEAQALLCWLEVLFCGEGKFYRDLKHLYAEVKAVEAEVERGQEKTNKKRKHKSS